MKKELLDNLKQRIESLQLAATGDLAEVERALFAKDYKLPEGCPSKASAAELVLRHTEEKLRWVNAAFKELKGNLFK
jgi:hypothetical protein